MSKGLEALEGIKDLLPHLDKPYIKIIETELKRLEESEIDAGTWKEIAEHKQKEFNIIHEECVRLTEIKNKQDKILQIIKEKLDVKEILLAIKGVGTAQEYDLAKEELESENNENRLV